MNKMMKTILTISAAVVAVAGIAALVVHFWEDLCAMLPGKKDCEDCGDFVDEAAE